MLWAAALSGTSLPSSIPRPSEMVAKELPFSRGRTSGCRSTTSLASVLPGCLTSFRPPGKFIATRTSSSSTTASATALPAASTDRGGSAWPGKWAPPRRRRASPVRELPRARWQPLAVQSLQAWVPRTAWWTPLPTHARETMTVEHTIVTWMALLSRPVSARGFARMPTRVPSEASPSEASASGPPGAVDPPARWGGPPWQASQAVPPLLASDASLPLRSFTAWHACFTKWHANTTSTAHSAVTSFRSPPARLAKVHKEAASRIIEISTMPQMGDERPTVLLV
mmetsp:Transcript_42522/g.110717  ORF Transcript_42522/g.110717 Transcript_42522/m.110717 type:complete len:283 (-) Transcript_42522:1070-1918(-)